MIAMFAPYFFLTKTPAKGSATKQNKIFSGNQIIDEMIRQRKELADKIAEDFRRIGWDAYGSATHITDDQIRRMRRAVESTRMEIIRTNPEQQCVYVQGDKTSWYTIEKYGCSCPDCEERYLPCKHMYFLVFSLVGNHPDEDVEKVQRLFSTMPGWNEWPHGIHKEAAQFARLRLGIIGGSGISVMCYDPKYKIAKVLDMRYANKGRLYFTRPHRCDCADFQKRKYPCKHMYALAKALDSDIEKYISDHEHPPLHGIKFTLVGHFPRKSKSYAGVQEELSNLSGPYSIYQPYYSASAILLGENPSEKRQLFVKESGLEVFTLETIRELFQEKI